MTILTHFLQEHSIDDILTPVVGELLEYSTDSYTAWYGNGELILESETESRTFVVDRIGFYPTLSEL